MLEVELKDNKLGIAIDLNEPDAKALFEQLTQTHFLSNMIAQHYSNRDMKPDRELDRDL
jgi:hypothetical protein